MHPNATHRLMLVASLASALSPSYPFLLAMRALVGVGIGGVCLLAWTYHLAPSYIHLYI